MNAENLGKLETDSLRCRRICQHFFQSVNCLRTFCWGNYDPTVTAT